MSNKNVDKLIEAYGMLQGLSWAIEDKCDTALEGLWIAIDRIGQVIDSERGFNDEN